MAEKGICLDSIAVAVLTQDAARGCASIYVKLIITNRRMILGDIVPIQSGLNTKHLVSCKEARSWMKIVKRFE